MTPPRAGRAAVGRAGPAAAVATAIAAVALLPLAVALADRHLAAGPPALVLSTAAGALAVSLLALQPLLVTRVRRPGPVVRRRAVLAHRLLGSATLALVLVHVAGLYVVSPEDTMFALSPDGPTRARMAVLATVALVVVVALGLGRGRLRLHPATWRVLHAFFATLVLVLGVGHAVLTDGALDDVGTPVLLALGAVGLAGVLAARLRARLRRSG